MNFYWSAIIVAINMRVAHLLLAVSGHLSTWWERETQVVGLFSNVFSDPKGEERRKGNGGRKARCFGISNSVKLTPQKTLYFHTYVFDPSLLLLVLSQFEPCKLVSQL